METRKVEPGFAGQQVAQQSQLHAPNHRVAEWQGMSSLLTICIELILIPISDLKFLPLFLFFSSPLSTNISHPCYSLEQLSKPFSLP